MGGKADCATNCLRWTYCNFMQKSAGQSYKTRCTVGYGCERAPTELQTASRFPLILAPEGLVVCSAPRRRAADLRALDWGAPAARSMASMATTQTTLEFDEELLRQLRTHVARSGRSEAAVVQEAVRRYLDSLAGLERVVRRMQGRGHLDEAEGLALAYGELHAMRSERR